MYDPFGRRVTGACVCSVGVLLIQAAEQWYAEHEGQLPKNYPEQKQFKAMLQAGVRQVEGVPLDVSPLRKPLQLTLKNVCVFFVWSSCPCAVNVLNESKREASAGFCLQACGFDSFL